MGLGRLQPGCVCCSCIGWDGTPPSEIQLTLPSSCDQAGVHTLDAGFSDGDCITGDFPIDHVCAEWGIFEPDWGPEGVAIGVIVGDHNGIAVVMAAICGDCPRGIGTFNSGTIWELSPPGIKHYDNLDGLILPQTNQENGGCSGEIVCGSGDVLIEIPP